MTTWHSNIRRPGDPPVPLHTRPHEAIGFHSGPWGWYEPFVAWWQRRALRRAGWRCEEVWYPPTTWRDPMEH